MAVQSVTASTTGPTASLGISLDSRLFGTGVSLLINFAPGTIASADVEISNDQIHWNKHDTAVNLTASTNADLDRPVGAVRLNVTQLTSGNVTLSVAQLNI